MTASALASALTMRGGSMSSGSWLMTRPTASRMSEAATFEIDAVVEFDGDAAALERRGRRDRLDAADARHRALQHRGQLAVDGFGGRRREIGGDGDDRPVDVGQLADLDAVEGGHAGDGDQRVDDEGQHRPAHEQRRDAFFALAVRGFRRSSRSAASRQEPPVGAGTAAAVRGWRSSLRRLRARYGCPPSPPGRRWSSRPRPARSRCCAG